MSDPTPFPLGTVVRIAGKHGRYTVKRTYPTGEVLLWGGTYMHEKYRQVTADKLRPAVPVRAKRLAAPFIALALPACVGPAVTAPAEPTISPVPSTTSTAPAINSTSTLPSTTTTVTTVMQAEPEPVASPQRAADGPGIGSARASLLACIRSYEQGADGYATDTGNGFYGAFQFDLPTWRSVGGTGNPAHASPAEQNARAWALYKSRGLAPWPTPERRCS